MSKFARILPSMCFILVWLSALHSQRHHTALVSLIQCSTTAGGRTWSLLATLCNELEGFTRNGELLACSIEQFVKQGKCILHNISNYGQLFFAKISQIPPICYFPKLSLFRHSSTFYPKILSTPVFLLCHRKILRLIW